MDGENKVQSYEHDIRGQICPSALLTTLKELNVLKEKLQAGRVTLVIKTDNRDATTTIPGAATKMGYDVSVTRDDGGYTISIGKKMQEQGSSRA